MPVILKLISLLAVIAGAGLLIVLLLPIILVVFVYMLLFGRKIPLRSSRIYSVFKKPKAAQKSYAAPVDSDIIDTFAQEVPEKPRQ